MGAFWAVAVGFEPHPAFFNKNNSTWADSGVCCGCCGCPQLSGWVGGHGVKFNFGYGNVHDPLGHSAGSLTCFTLLSNTTPWLRLSTLEWLSGQSAEYLFYWTPQQRNLAALSHLALSPCTLWTVRESPIWKPTRGEAAAGPQVQPVVGVSTYSQWPHIHRHTQNTHKGKQFPLWLIRMKVCWWKIHNVYIQISSAGLRHPVSPVAAGGPSLPSADTWTYKPPVQQPHSSCWYRPSHEHTRKHQHTHVSTHVHAHSWPGLPRPLQ